MPPYAPRSRLPQPDGAEPMNRHLPSAVTTSVVKRASASSRQSQAYGQKTCVSHVLLVTGEPGIGKSHLLGYVAERMTCRRGPASGVPELRTRSVTPLRYLVRYPASDRAHAGLAKKLPADLAMLLPDVGTMAEPGDRSRFFDAVVDLLRQVTAERPSAITFDDIQWIDDASCSLLHYVGRHVDSASGLLVVCAARDWRDRRQRGRIKPRAIALAREAASKNRSHSARSRKTQLSSFA